MQEYTKKPTINAVPTSNKPNKEEFLTPILGDAANLLI